MRNAPTMSAAVLVAPQQFEVRELPVPVPGDGEVRVRLEGCGVCGSNLPPWEGRPWFKYPLPAGQPGHEGWGTVDAVGAGVTTVREGQRVAVLSYHAYAAYDLAPQNQLVPLPAQLEQTPFPGEALGCAWNVLRRCQIEAGERVAVVGVGFLGALLTQLAVWRGADVFAIARRPIALDLAKRFGATATIPWDDPWQAAGQIKDLTAGQGCDCVIEAVGAQPALDLASEITRERGRLVIAGYHQDGPRQVNLQLWNWRGLDVINAHERDPRVYLEGIQGAVRAVERGWLDPAPLFTDRFPLQRIGDAFASLQSRPARFMKALIEL